MGLLLLGGGAGCLTSRIRYDEEAPPRPEREWAEEARTRFLCYTGDRRAPGDLVTESRLYRREDGVEVLLLAMIHFADPAFYDEVARRLSRASVVLLEGGLPGGGLGAAPASTSEGALASDDAGEVADVFAALELVPQPEGAALGPAGPRYASGDVAPDDLARRIAAAGRGPTARPEFPTTRFALDRFLFTISFQGDDFRRAWRHAFAGRLEPAEKGSPVRSLLIDPRNAALLAALDRELSLARTGPLRAAVPWGSEHMPGIEEGLLARRFRLVSRERLVAWRVRSYAG